VGAPGLENGGRGAERYGVWGGVSPFPLGKGLERGLCALPRKKFDFGFHTHRFIAYGSPKAGSTKHNKNKKLHHYTKKRKNHRLLSYISNRRILVQTGCFLYSSPKAGLNTLPTVITLGTPFPGVSAGNDPSTQLNSSQKSQTATLRL